MLSPRAVPTALVVLLAACAGRDERALAERLPEEVFVDVGPDAGVEVDIRYEDCDPRVDCVPQRLSSTGALEREIFDGIRARLEAGT